MGKKRNHGFKEWGLNKHYLDFDTLNNSNLDNPNSTYVIDNPEYLNIYAGGLFHEYDGVRRVGLARINNDGSIDTTFMDSSFNQFAGIPRRAAKDQRNFIRDIEFSGPSKDIFISGSFDIVGGGYDNFSYSPQNNITRINGNRYGPVSYTHLTLPTNREV